MSSTGPNPRRPSRAARAAGLAFLPLPLVPFVLGLASVVDNPNRPGSGCFEYCEFDQNIGRLALGLGIVGIWLAVLIWRRHVAAMALAMFLTALLTLIWSIALVAPTLAGQFALVLQAPILAIGAMLITQDVLLVAALREEMNRAGDRAAAAETDEVRQAFR